MTDFKDQFARLRIELDEDTAEAQRTEIRRTLARYRRAGRVPRRRFAVAAVTLLLVLQASVVWAAEDALPGDVLYDVKRAYETPRSWVDGDVRLRNRLTEAEQLIATDPVTAEDLLGDAAEEVDRESDQGLVAHLEGLRVQLRTRAHDGTGGGVGSGGGNTPGGGQGSGGGSQGPGVGSPDR